MRKWIAVLVLTLLTVGVSAPVVSAATSRVTAQNCKFEGWKLYGNVQVGNDPVTSFRVTFEGAVGIASSSLEMTDGTPLSGLKVENAKLLSDNDSYYVEFTFDSISNVQLTVRAKALSRPNSGPRKAYLTCEATNDIVFSSNPATTLPPQKNLTLPSPGADGLTPFTDVTGHWAESKIAAVAGGGYIPKEMLTETSFKPNNVVTRGEFIAVIAGLAPDTVGNIVLAFQDVKTSDYYYNAVKWGVGNSIVSGVSETAFSPKASVSRQDAAVIIHRFLSSANASAYKVDFTPPKNQKNFTDDYAIADYAKNAVYAVQAAGIISGNPDGSFAPGDGITRAQLSVIISQILTTRK